MTMMDALAKEIKKLPFEMKIVGKKDTARIYQATLMYEGDTSVVDLQRTCAPGMAGKYCWQVIVTAMLDIYQKRGDFEKANLWLKALRYPSLITAEKH